MVKKFNPFIELDNRYLIPANTLIGDSTDWEAARDFVNACYWDVLKNDVRVIEEVICVMQARGYLYVKNKLYSKNCHDIEEIVSEATLQIYEKRLFNFEGQVTDPQFFYAHLMKFFEFALYKYCPGETKELSIQAWMENIADNEKSVNDPIIKGLEDRKNDPAVLLLQKEEKQEQTQMGEAFIKAIMNATIIPHELISFCYSVILPKILMVLLEEHNELYNEVDKSAEYVWQHACKEPFSEMDRGLNEKQYAQMFTDNFKKYFQTISSPFSLEDFCLKNIVIPVLEKNICDGRRRKDISSDKLNFLRQLVDGLKIYGNDLVDVNRKNLILAETAKFYMNSDTIREMSGKFADVYNCSVTGNCVFQWGNAYKKALDSAYTKYHHTIKNEGSLVYAEYFSKPMEGETIRQGFDYLVNNIRRYAERTLKSLVKNICLLRNNPGQTADQTKILKDYASSRLKKYNSKMNRKVYL